MWGFSFLFISVAVPYGECLPHGIAAMQSPHGISRDLYQKRRESRQLPGRRIFHNAQLNENLGFAR